MSVAGYVKRADADDAWIRSIPHIYRFMYCYSHMLETVSSYKSIMHFQKIEIPVVPSLISFITEIPGLFRPYDPCFRPFLTFKNWVIPWFWFLFTFFRLLT